MNGEAIVLGDGFDLLLFKPLDDVGFSVEERKRARRGVADEMILEAGYLRRT